LDCYLLGVAFGDEATEAALLVQLQSGQCQWLELGTMRVESGRLLLLHAACAGEEVELNPAREPAVIGDGLTVAIAPGLYVVAATEVGIGEDGFYNVVRWRPSEA
jgi:hypothetical protein